MLQLLKPQPPPPPLPMTPPLSPPHLPLLPLGSALICPSQKPPLSLFPNRPLLTARVVCHTRPLNGPSSLSEPPLKRAELLSNSSPFKKLMADMFCRGRSRGGGGGGCWKSSRRAITLVVVQGWEYKKGFWRAPKCQTEQHHRDCLKVWP